VTETRAYAKINLRHRVFAPEHTGFHSVETLMLRTGLFDSVGLAEAPEGWSVDLDGEEAAGVPAGDDNLCCRAARLYLDRAFGRTRPGVRIRLTKRIPPGSGLGGGSADAGAVLRLLARRWPRLDERELVQLAGEIGSDVPFALMADGFSRCDPPTPARPSSRGRRSLSIRVRRTPASRRRGSRQTVDPPTRGVPRYSRVPIAWRNGTAWPGSRATISSHRPWPRTRISPNVSRCCARRRLSRA
jgi:hypothetical protein